MTEKEICNLTYETLNKYLSTYGYKYIKSQMRFELKIKDNVYGITFSCVNRKPQYLISLFFFIRNDNIEYIANKFTQANPNYFKYSTTVIIPFTYFLQKRFDFKVTNESDFQNINIFFPSFYKDTIEPFILNHSSLDQLSVFVGNAIKESNNFFPISIDLYRRYIILLKLTNDIDFENHVNDISTKISSYHTLYKQNFEDTYKYLKTLQI